MTPDAAGIEAALAEVLAAHADCLLNGKDGPGAITSGVDTWSCGLTLPFVDDLDQAERAHVAAALLPVVTQAQAEALREAADALSAMGNDGFPADWLRERAGELYG
jgi:hypothetical protein